ncbi:SDR family oxidoreductase [Arthrobacter sp. IA7]|uniref:SDR family oxidoreductase n=1 Tax=Arthrobacter ipis TaxID=2716202 RepID=UPI00168395D4|nr:SDR family oxidoreductase [Arthrobacter ipis]MBD1541385.1 SDR family oxidoreductase [Arthrobacter ipis]
MTIVITGATGQLGRLVVEALLESGLPAEQIVAAGRTVDRIADLAERGVQVRTIDYSQPESLRQAFAGADKILLVSGSEVGQRVEQHRNAIDAAKEAGAGLIAYTSVANADTTAMKLADEHIATEEILRDSGVPFVLLRNGWYLENYTGQLPVQVQHGAVFGSAGDGRVSAAARADYAAAAAAVLLQEDQGGKVYELGGDNAFTLSELAGEVSAASGKPVTYKDLPAEQYTEVLVGAGLPEPYAAILADSDLGIARGDLLVTSGDLSALLGRPTTPLREAVQAAAEGLQSN